MISKKKLLELVFQLILAIIITFILVLNENLVFSLILIILYIFYSWKMVNFEPLNPVVWFTPFLFLYHFSVLILDILGVRQASHENSILLIGWISIMVITLLITTFTSKITKNEMHNLNISDFVLRNMYLVLIFLGLIHNIAFLRSGSSVKSEAALNSSIFPLDFVHNWYLLVYGLWLYKSLSKKREVPKLLVIFTFVISLFSTLNLGERNIILTFMIITIFILYNYFKFSKIYFYITGILGVFILPILGDLKNIFTKSEIIISNENLLVQLFSGEFLSAGRNIETLLKNSSLWDYFYGSTILGDIGRTLIPGFVYTIQNAQGWFNRTFHLDIVLAGRGYGFSLAGEGFINFGYIGVIIWFAILSFILVFLYRKSSNSILYFIIYLSVIPYTIYSLRGDFSTLLSPILKSVIFVIVLLYIINRILIKEIRNKKLNN